MFQLTTPLTPAPGRSGTVAMPGAGGGKGAVAIPDFLSFALPVVPEGNPGKARQDPAGGGEAVPGGTILVPPAGHPDMTDSAIDSAAPVAAGSGAAVQADVAMKNAPAFPNASSQVATRTPPTEEVTADTAVIGLPTAIAGPAQQTGQVTGRIAAAASPDALPKAADARGKPSRAVRRQDVSPEIRVVKKSITEASAATSETDGPAAKRMAAATDAPSREDTATKDDATPGDVPAVAAPTLPVLLMPAATENTVDAHSDGRNGATAPVVAAPSARPDKGTAPAAPIADPQSARSLRSLPITVPRTAIELPPADRGGRAGIASVLPRDTGYIGGPTITLAVPTASTFAGPRIATDAVVTAPGNSPRRSDPAAVSLGAVARMLESAKVASIGATADAATATLPGNPVLAPASAPRVAALPAMPASVASFLASVGPRPVAVPLSDAKPVADQRGPILTAAVSPKTAPAVPAAPIMFQPAGQVFAEAIHAATGRGERVRNPPGEGDALGVSGMTAAPTISTATTATVDRAPLDMAQAHWPMKMIERIEYLRDAADAQDTRIKLIPDVLGAIDVSLKRDGDTVRVHLAAERPETRAMLADAQPRLAELGEQRGLKIAASSGQANGQAGAQDFHQPRGNAAPQQPARPASAGAGTSPADEDDGDQRLA